jgi:hypothetical protein
VFAPDEPVETSGLLGGELGAVPVVESGRAVGLARAADVRLLVQRLLRAPVR